MKLKKRILIAPLNWGLGHATRCIPIINALIEFGFEPILASDGAALLLLKQEFPSLKTIELPSYNISYSKEGKQLKLKLLKDTPQFLRTINAEKKLISEVVHKYKIDGIISDNRFGIRHHKLPSVIITHQINVLSGNTTWFSSKINQQFIKKFDECWVPDSEGTVNLSGKLGHLNKTPFTTKYIGILSRFKALQSPIKNDLLVILSGPEPQRSIFETILLEELKKFNGTTLFVKGIIDRHQTIEKKGEITIFNYMTSGALEKAISESEMVLSRSGYTTIMDLAKMKKKAFFVPTPGQFEQEYLARRLDKKKNIPFCAQKDFSIDQLSRINDNKGFHNFTSETNFKDLFGLF